MPGAKKPCTALGRVDVRPPGLMGAKMADADAAAAEPSSSVDAMTSKDYYFDSYSHFGRFICPLNLCVLAC